MLVTETEAALAAVEQGGGQPAAAAAAATSDAFEPSAPEKRKRASSGGGLGRGVKSGTEAVSDALTEDTVAQQSRMQSQQRASRARGRGREDARSSARGGGGTVSPFSESASHGDGDASDAILAGALLSAQAQLGSAIPGSLVALQLGAAQQQTEHQLQQQGRRTGGGIDAWGSELDRDSGRDALPTAPPTLLPGVSFDSLRSVTGVGGSTRASPGAGADSAAGGLLGGAETGQAAFLDEFDRASRGAAAAAGATSAASSGGRPAGSSANRRSAARHQASEALQGMLHLHSSGGLPSATGSVDAASGPPSLPSSAPGSAPGSALAPLRLASQMSMESVFL